MPTTLGSGLQGPMTPSLVVVQCLCLSDNHDYGFGLLWLYCRCLWWWWLILLLLQTLVVHCIVVLAIEKEVLHPPKRSTKRATARVRGLVKRMHEQARAVVSLFHSFLPPPPPVNSQQFDRARDEMLLAFLLFFSLSSLQSSACGTRYYTDCCVGK